jgi:hypothetical protein
MDTRYLSIAIIAGGIALTLTIGACAKMFFVYGGVDDDAIVVNIGEEYFGSTVGATCTDESRCGYDDKYAVWHSYTPQSNQTVTISLCGSTFDTTLAVFDACEGIELACNNDYCGLQSALTADLTAGRTYLIRVAGYDSQMGDYTLTLTDITYAHLNVNLTIDSLWMYQNLPGRTASNLTASVSIVGDPLSNSSYTYRWEFILPADVNVAPAIVSGGSVNDAFCTFAALGCDQPNGLSDMGLPYKIRVTVTGGSYGNTGTAEIEFGVALLGDINNDTVVDVADCSIVNAFWQIGSAGSYSLRDCDVNHDGVVDVADCSITNAIWRGILGQNHIGVLCHLR